MNSIEFGRKCQPFNKEYKELFGKVPCPDDYACNRDEFFDALKKAIETKTEIEKLVSVRAINSDPTKIF
ncbi:MAG: hypothetical protein IKQ25_09130 [Lachnospiraceae bacterium]|nr:hypothetical protein [Lachnospiraceae bacterium]MBR6151431.1 hypothetical protein [Lachnospiraceae bacterium]